MTTLKISEIRRGEPTVTVTTIWGETFEAPAKGPVLSSDYIPSDEQINEILDVNSERVSVDPEEIFIGDRSAKECYDHWVSVEEIEQANRKHYDKLPKFFDYTRKGARRKRK